MSRNKDVCSSSPKTTIELLSMVATDGGRSPSGRRLGKLVMTIKEIDIDGLEDQQADINYKAKASHKTTFAQSPRSSGPSASSSSSQASKRGQQFSPQRGPYAHGSTLSATQNNPKHTHDSDVVHDQEMDLEDQDPEQRAYCDLRLALSGYRWLCTLGEWYTLEGWMSQTFQSTRGKNVQVFKCMYTTGF